MISIIATVQIREDKVEIFEATARKLEQQVKEHEEGCLLYRMSKSRTAPLTYMNTEIFRDQAALDLHQAAAHFQAALGTIADCLSDAPVVEFFDTLV